MATTAHRPLEQSGMSALCQKRTSASRQRKHRGFAFCGLTNQSPCINRDASSCHSLVNASN